MTEKEKSAVIIYLQVFRRSAGETIDQIIEEAEHKTSKNVDTNQRNCTLLAMITLSAMIALSAV